MSLLVLGCVWQWLHSKSRSSTFSIASSYGISRKRVLSSKKPSPQNPHFLFIFSWPLHAKLMHHLDIHLTQLGFEWLGLSQTDHHDQ